MDKQIIIVKLDGLLFGIDVDVVQEIVYNFIDRTLPEAPNFVEGLAFIRETLIPIIRIKRLFNSPFFDLYNNKKILVLNFNRHQGNNEDTTNNSGIIVDEVVGIENYHLEEVIPLNHEYGPSFESTLTGAIQRKGKEIALFNIDNFFYNQDGTFRYRHYFGKQIIEIFEVSKRDYDEMQSLMEEKNFPLNALSLKPIISYLNKIAAYEERSIKEVLTENPDLLKQNKHMTINPIKTTVFSNFGDMSTFLEYAEISLRTETTANILIIDSGDGFDVLSIMFIYQIFKKSHMKFNFLNMGTDEDIVEKTIEQDFIYSKESLVTMPEELYPNFFNNIESPTGEIFYRLKPELKNNIQIEKINFDSLINEKREFDIIYAPNYLIQHMDEIRKNIQIFEKLLAKNGLLVLGLFEDIGGFGTQLKKHYIRSRLVFLKE